MFITDKESLCLEELKSSGFQYIARNFDSSVFAYAYKPVLVGYEWKYNELSKQAEIKELDPYCFGFLVWNHKPWKISDLLNKDKIRHFTKSDGVVCFRKGRTGLEILAAHPGGPFYANKEFGCWSVVKGEQDTPESDEDVARREFYEETGFHIVSENLFIFPGNSYILRSNKAVFLFGLEKDLDESVMKSNLCQVEFPPHSGNIIDIPENDRYRWFSAEEIGEYLYPSQKETIDNFIKWAKENGYE